MLIQIVRSNAERASQARVSDGQARKKEAKQLLGSISSAVVNSNQIIKTKKKKVSITPWMIERGATLTLLTFIQLRHGCQVPVVQGQASSVHQKEVHCKWSGQTISVCNQGHIRADVI